MSYITFTPGQSVKLMSIHGASISQALQSTLELVSGTTLEYADLVHDGFTMSVYLDSNIDQLAMEYWNWKKQKACKHERMIIKQRFNGYLVKCADCGSIELSVPRDKVLRLTLNKKAFEVMVTGEKKEEFRKKTDWLESRLFEGDTLKYRDYYFILFVNGYGNGKPWFLCGYDGCQQAYMHVAPRTYSNGLVVDDIISGDYIISCGDIVAKGNLNSN